jgi:hypothetical protein
MHCGEIHCHSVTYMQLCVELVAFWLSWMIADWSLA